MFEMGCHGHLCWRFGGPKGAQQEKSVRAQQSLETARGREGTGLSGEFAAAEKFQVF